MIASLRSTHVIVTLALAEAGGYASVLADGNMNILADSNSAIDAVIITVSASVSVSSGPGGSIGVGVSYAQNEIATDVAAIISGATLVEANALTMTATDDSSIDAVTLAVSVGISSGGSVSVAITVAAAINFSVTLVAERMARPSYCPIISSSFALSLPTSGKKSTSTPLLRKI